MNTTPSVRSELKILPIILTVVLVAMGAAVSGFFSLPMAAMFLGTAPVAVMLLWLTREVPAPEDRIAAVDAERAKLRKAAEPRPVARAA